MTQAPAPAASAEHRFPCDQCGADLRFDPAANALVCAHCGNQQDIVAGPWGGTALKELDFRTAIAKQLPQAEMEETRTVSCTNCGATIEFDPDTHATECPFCASPVVTDTGTNRHIKPRGVLPFAYDEKSAHDAMNTWLGRLWFAPNGLKQYARKGRRMEGIYVPYWTFDAKTASSYTGERGTVYYVTQTVVQNGKRVQRQVPKVRWNPARGRVARFFDDVLVLASTGLPKSYTDALQPWDLSRLETYQPQYLAGFRAEAYSVELENGFTEARQYMDRVIERGVRFDIGGDQQCVHSIDTSLSDVTFKHILLPVWLAAYKYRGETYRFVVNGQTGRVQGERPYSAVKIAIAVIFGLILAAAFGYIANQSG